MGFLFLWRSADEAYEEAARRFSGLIAKQRRLYEEAFGHPIEAHVHQIRSLFVGLLAYPTGITGWEPWQQHGPLGIAWSGVCESRLGPTTPAALRTSIDVITRRPAQLAEWDGRFAACAWDDAAAELTLATGAVDSPSLWQAAGPRGWAAGSKALPLLELVGRAPAIDRAAASLFVASGYLAGSEALFQHVTRVPSRQQIRLTPERVEARSYLSLGAYLEAGEVGPTWEAVVERQAALLVARVGRQAEHSPAPRLLLTGGRDSRSIATALVTSGHSMPAQTMGPSSSIDVRIAAQVSQALGIDHTREQHPQTRPLDALIGNRERLGLWLQLTEGVQTIRHALAFQPFFAAALPYPAERVQFFHGLRGLGGERLRGPGFERDGYALGAPVDRAAAHRILRDAVPAGLLAREAAQDALQRWLVRFEHDLRGMPMTWGVWFNLFYWQSRALQWGADDMSTKDVIAWHWTPLLNGEFTRAYLRLPEYRCPGKQLIQDMTVAMAPALRTIRYDKRTQHPLAALKRSLRWGLEQAQRYGVPLPAGLRQRGKRPSDGAMLAFWDAIFFQSPACLWRDLVDEPFVRSTLARSVHAEELWSLATVELVARASSDRL